MPLLPPVLLAGDYPDAALWGEENEDTQRPPVAPVPPFPEPMPLWMRPRDPYCVVIFWQPDVAALQAWTNPRPGETWRLRLLGGDAFHELLSDEALPLDTDHRFVAVPNAGGRYVAEVGIRDSEGAWRLLTRSAPVTTPVAGPTATWVPQPPVAPHPDPVPSATTIPSPEPPSPLPDHPSAPESADKLWALALEPALPAPSLSSAELAQGIARPPKAPPLPGSSEAGILPDVGPSSAGLAAAPARSFWFEVNAELILYGRTERDAKVTLAGRPIALRPDGSFRFQFILPDGVYDLPIVAVSAAGDDGRFARLEFSRTTTLQGEVGVHPQDPSLGKPGAESVR
ncbi:MAG: DUF4912 domain-containing protein [Verrucomicrobiae bacterium]|nr:DUF4912 domain-containing protein [Verrucomicrobiae bacterium]